MSPSPRAASAGLTPRRAAGCLWRRASEGNLGRGRGLLELGGDVPGSRRVDADAGPHRARQRDRVDVAALGRGRFGADDLHDGRVVLEERALVEALAADREVDVGASVGAVLELARLRVADGLAHVEGDRPRLRVRHLPARTGKLISPISRSGETASKDIPDSMAVIKLASCKKGNTGSLNSYLKR